MSRLVTLGSVLVAGAAAAPDASTTPASAEPIPVVRRYEPGPPPHLAGLGAIRLPEMGPDFPSFVRAQPPAPPITAKASPVVSPSELVKTFGITPTATQRDTVQRELVPELIRLDAELRKETRDKNGAQGGAGFTEKDANAAVDKVLDRAVEIFRGAGIKQPDGASKVQFVAAGLRSCGYLCDASAYQVADPGNANRKVFGAQFVLVELVDVPKGAIEVLVMPKLGHIPPHEYKIPYIKVHAGGLSMPPEDLRKAPERFRAYGTMPSEGNGKLVWGGTIYSGTDAFIRNFFATAKLTEGELQRYVNAQAATEAALSYSTVAVCRFFPATVMQLNKEGEVGLSKSLFKVPDYSKKGQTLDMSFNQAWAAIDMAFFVEAIKDPRGNIPEVAAQFRLRQLWRECNLKDADPSSRDVHKMFKAAVDETIRAERLGDLTQDKVADLIFHNEEKFTEKLFARFRDKLVPFVESDILPQLRASEEKLAK